ncbi:MAG: DUF3343 domain-containing protein [Clostridiales bacterium]|nr:DUF3343 domain-containing protein [Clostridiales bacterium]
MTKGNEIEMYTIFAFQSRAQAMTMYSSLKRAGIGSALMTTPREVSLGCGLSVKICEQSYREACSVLYAVENDTFLGAFRLYYEGRRTCVERIRGGF